MLNVQNFIARLPTSVGIIEGAVSLNLTMQVEGEIENGHSSEPFMVCHEVEILSFASNFFVNFHREY